jgi:hypothetical protein
MAGSLSASKLPLINQSISKSIRSGVFRSKAPLGPGTAQAITEGTLEVESKDQREREAANQALAEDKRQADLQATVTRENYANQRDMQNTRLEAEREQAKLIADQEAADRYDSRRAAKKAEAGFLDGLIGS